MASNNLPPATNPNAVDGLCHNAQRGSFNHECGKPATWVGTKANGFQSGFCDDCRLRGDERTPYIKWEPHPRVRDQENQ